MTNHTETNRQARPIAPKVNELISSTKSIILGTIDSDGNPTASYAPYVRVGNDFYILVSFMARHTKNLLNGKASALFIEDESTTKQVYARERLTLDTITEQIDRNSATWNEVVSQLKNTHGKVVEMISEMQDFILIKLKPTKGSYVNGFGSAYFVDENLEITQHRNDVNHQTK
ncbi:HugZ family protein [Capnocytophaga sp. ARDL2]|uniref:HugZ family pyridoxamine 5'-phosphate oxidase n=1 Tax=Capnocytophaga sp. ARDL2 TaxID=3238809 RepID=UPI003558C33E